jgi:hypothetical protein
VPSVGVSALLTFVLRVASSSRSQLAVRMACDAAYLTWGRPSVSVHWRPSGSVAIDTQLVTRFVDESAAVRWCAWVCAVIATQLVITWPRPWSSISTNIPFIPHS